MKKITYKLVGLYVFVCLLCISCLQDDSIAPREPGEEPVPEGYVKMLFTVKDASNPQSYASTGTFSDEEIGKEDLMMLIFRVDAEFNKDSELRYDRARRMTYVSQGKYSILLPSSMAGQLFDIVICANASEVVGQNPDDKLMYKKEGFAYEIGRTYQEFTERMIFDIPATGWPVADSFKLLPMWGKKSAVQFTVDQLGTALPLGTVKLLRSVARVDVGLNYTGTELGDAPQGLGEVFKIKKIHIANTLTKGRLAPDVANYTVNESDMGSTLSNPYTVNAPSLTSPAADITDWIEVVAPTEGVGVVKKVFLPEQLNSATVALNERPCVIIEGEYKPVGAANAKTYFYRLDLKNKIGDQDTYFNILRGNLIRLNITDVKGPGLKTRAEALNSLPINVDVSVTNYNLLLDNTVIDGQYHFSVAKKEVTMPRDAGVKYALKVSSDILVADWELEWTNQDQFDITAFQDSIVIVNKQNWVNGATTQDDVLKITAKRLRLSIPIHQTNMSVSDWQMGNEEEKVIEGGNILSTSSLSMTGSSGSEVVSIFDDVYKEFTVTVSNDAPWLTVVQLGGFNRFLFSVTVNPLSQSREAVVTLANGSNSYVVKVSQSSLILNDVLDEKRAVLWRGQNVGAISNSEFNNEFSIYTKDVLTQMGDAVCPKGWVVPTLSDFKALSAAPFGHITLDLAGNNDHKYMVMFNGKDKMYFMPHKNVMTDPTAMAFWTSQDGFVKFSYTPEAGFGSEVTADSSIGSGYVRCVRKLKLEQSEVDINMSGEAVNVNFTTLSSGDLLSIDIPDKTFSVVIEGSHFVVTRREANLSDQAISTTVTFSTKTNPTVKQTLKINQLGKVPLASENNYIRIGNLDWYFKNVGATSAEDGHAYYNNPFSTAPTSAPTKKVNEASFGTLYDYGTASTKCADIGTGWRLPTIKEWMSLLARTKYVLKSYQNAGIDSEIPHNETNYPSYLVSDGNRMMYFPVTPHANGFPKDQRDLLAYYWSASYTSSTVRYYVTFARVLNKKSGEAFIEPGVQKNLFQTDPDNYLISNATNTAAIPMAVRCVKTVTN